MPRIAFVTHRGLPALSSDDQLALPALAARGITVVPAAWDGDATEWRAFDALVIRSTWNYHEQPRAFARWLDRLDHSGVVVWNPIPVLRWNADKRYLATLAGTGIPVVPTRWVETADDAPSLSRLLIGCGWTDAVVKPTISASAHETWRVTGTPDAADEARFDAALRRGAMMIQPFVPAVMTDGEWSLCFFGGEFSHAVRKQARAGDFRVQEEHGGTTRAAVPPQALVAQAARVLEALDEPPLYARVDGCELDGRLVLMELELLEPSLFLAHDAKAPERFADAVARTLAGRQALGRGA